jgi:DNA topoisomerase-1
VSQPLETISIDAVESAKAACLRYINDTSKGIARKKVGRGWRFLSPEGEPIRDKATLDRIARLVIPPAWKNVWISPFPNTHLQAIGYDARGRKQYRYHEKYSEVRNQNKFSRVAAFAKILPRVRKRLNEDLAKPGLSRERVLATVVRLLETTYIRIGNEEYAKQNKSFGLTTLKNRHVDLDGATIRFHFRGKSGREHEVELHDRRLARIIRNCHDLPGCELFQYIDETGARHCIDSGDVNDYIRSVAGDSFSAKDFRTWAGTFLATQNLVQAGPADSETAIKKKVAEIVKFVAASLGNRPATCRKYYIHPAVIDAYTDGRLFEAIPPGRAPGETSVRKLIEHLEAQKRVRVSPLLKAEVPLRITGSVLQARSGA